MTVKTEDDKRVYDWDSLEYQFMTSPWLNLSQFARETGIPDPTLKHAAKRGDWIPRRDARYKDFYKANSERMAGILEEDGNNDISAFKALEDRVKRLALASLELIVPPEDAPIEAQTAARNRLEQMSAKQLSEIVNQSLRTLTETGRHRRLLTGQATALFGRADAPDVLIDEPIDDARELEMRSRMAQIALRASINGEPLDIEYQVIPPAESPPRTISPNRSISPIPPDSPALGGL